GLIDRFHTLSLSFAPRLCPVAVDITMLTTPETTAGGSVFRDAVSKTLPASASDQRNAFPEVIKIPESKATAFQTLDSAVYSFNRTVGEIILDAVKNSCHVLIQGGDGCVHVLTRTTVVFQKINDPLPVFFFSALNTS
ncbi:MAG: hypothetical protein MR027_03275, partial [Ligilactobacillus ruminis]|nr:hypothetical protein [Ligilactobacillus ruminis]